MVSRMIAETRRMQQEFDETDRPEIEEASALEEVPAAVPHDGTYHELNARGEIPFTPNERIGRNASRSSENSMSQGSQS